MCFGTHGQSFTMACGPAVRMKVFPLGLPDLTPTQSPPAEMGNQLVLYLLSCAWHFILRGGYLSLEIPERSLFGYIQKFSNSCGSLVLRQSEYITTHTERSFPGPLSFSITCPPAITCLDLSPGRVFLP